MIGWMDDGCCTTDRYLHVVEQQRRDLVLLDTEVTSMLSNVAQCSC